MLGAIIGDIVGSRFEFCPTNDYNFELFTDECDFTDDTICTVGVADALLHGRDFGESMHDWCNRYPYPTGGYGGQFARWVLSENPVPYNSFGNGAAMRVSPIGHWYAHQETDMLEAAAATALPSHNHPEGIKGAQTVALAIFKAKQHQRQDAPSHLREILGECAAFSGYDLNISRESVMNRFDVTCQGTVPVALWVIGQSSNFENAVRQAVSLGADADTLGAIVGSIAEAVWEIPEWMKEKALSYLADDMKTVVKEFYERVSRE